MVLREAYVQGPGFFRRLGYYRGTTLTGGGHLTKNVRTRPGFMVLCRNVPYHRIAEAEAALREEEGQE